jgi:hypothetical protein
MTQPQATNPNDISRPDVVRHRIRNRQRSIKQRKISSLEDLLDKLSMVLLPMTLLILLLLIVAYMSGNS